MTQITNGIYTQEQRERAAEGIDDVLEHIASLVNTEYMNQYIFAGCDTDSPPYVIERTAKGFRIEGARIQQAVRMTNFENEEGVRYLQRQLTRMGVFKALKRMGAEPGQSISIEDVEFEYHPD